MKHWLMVAAAFIAGVLARRPLQDMITRLPARERPLKPVLNAPPHAPRMTPRPPDIHASGISGAPSPRLHPSPADRREDTDSQLIPALAALGLGLAVALAVFGQRSLASQTVSVMAAMLYGLGLALFTALDLAARRTEAALATPRTVTTPAEEPDGPVDLRALKRARLTLVRRLALALGLGLSVWVLMRGRAPNDDYGLVMILWIGSLAAAWSAARIATERSSHGALAALTSMSGWIWPVLLLSTALLALLLRVIQLDHVPYVFGGDEGSQAMSAAAVLSGQLKNPFGTGWYSVPTLFFFLQAGAMALFGDSVFGARLVPALLGVAAVIVTFLFTRRLFGDLTATIAALLLATFHYHIHFSRLASNQIADSLAIVAVLYTLDRALQERRPMDALLAGIVIGLSQYFSFAGRIIPLVALASIVLSVAYGRLRLPWDMSKAPRRSIPVILLGWMALGAAIAYAPLAAYYLDHPNEFALRTNQVSMFTSGWLEREMQMSGRGAVDLTLNQIWRAVLLPFHTNPGGWYVNHRPFIGVPWSVALALGLTVATLGFWRREYRGLAIAYWASTLGLGLTEDPTQTQRYVVVSSLMAILAALAIAAAARVADTLARIPRVMTGVGTVLVVAGLASWSLLHYFGPRETRLYGDGSSLAATELAYYLQPLPAGTTAYFLGPPRMFYNGFQSIPFIARQVRGIDVPQPLTVSSPRPVINGPTVFAALPERAAELQVVQGWFPDGQIKPVTGPNGEPVLSVYEINR